MNAFTIEVTSKHADWGRYNVRIMCELQDAAGRRTGYAATDRKEKGCTVLTTEPCEQLRMFVYAIPESLPADRVVGDSPDFAGVLRVWCGDTKIGEERFDINRWGGASIGRICDSAGIKQE